MPRKIVITGRGGVGKSTFTAILVRVIDPPSLVVDLDPDLSLGKMLGIEDGKKTVCEVLYDVLKERESGKSPLVSIDDLFYSSIFKDGLFEGKGFDLLTLGFKDLEGCYCFPDYLLKKTIEKLFKNYRNLIIDSPAGLEHLNRNIVSEIDHLFILIDPSEKALRHIEKVKEIARAVGIRYTFLHVVANHMFGKDDEEYIREAGLSYVGNFSYDSTVEEYNLKGTPLLNIPEDSPIYSSVKEIIKRTIKG